MRKNGGGGGENPNSGYRSWNGRAVRLITEASLSTSRKKSVTERIISASLVVGLAHLCLKFAGLIQAKTATYFLESNEYETIFALTFTTIIYSLFLIGEESVGPSLMPVFVSELDERPEREAWQLPNILLTVQTLLLIAVTILIMVFPDFVIQVFSEWTADKNPNRYALMRESVRWLAPCLIFLSLGSTTYIILNSYKKFFLAAFGDASWKICVVISLIAGHFLGLGYRALFFGLLIGSAAKLLTHLAGMLGKLRYLRPSLRLNHRAFLALLLLILPLLVGIIFAKFRDAFNVRILTHIDQRGVIQAADLGKKLFSTISWLVPFTLQIALFPFLCDLAEKDDREGLGEVLTKSCRLLVAVFIPASLVLAVLSERFAVFLFLGGKTGLQVAVWTGVATACYVLLLPAAAVECVLMQGYFAKRKMVSVSVIGIVCSSISVIVSYVFVVLLDVGPMPALLVVALGFVVSRLLKSMVLAIVLGRSIPLFPWGPTVNFLVRLGVIGIVAGGASYGCLRLSNHLLDDRLESAKTEMWKYEHCRIKADTVSYQPAAGDQRPLLRLQGNVQLTNDLLDIRTEEMTVELSDDTAVLRYLPTGSVEPGEVSIRAQNQPHLGRTLQQLLCGLPQLVADASRAEAAVAELKAEESHPGAEPGRTIYTGKVEGKQDERLFKGESLEVERDGSGRLLSFRLVGEQIDGKVVEGATLRNDPMPGLKRLYMLIHLLLAGSVGAVVCLAGAWLLRVREPFQMLAWGIDKIRNRGRKSADAGPIEG